MATGMKHWLGATITGLAMACIWLLPPQAVDRTNRQVATGESRRVADLGAKVTLAGEVLRRQLWSDSLSALIAEAEDDVVVFYHDEKNVADDQKQRFAAVVRQEAEARGVGQNMRFGYVFQPYDHASRPGMISSQRDRTETFVGSRDGQDYCLQVRVHSPQTLPSVLAMELVGTDRDRPHSNQLGLCSFYLRYGFASEPIDDWIEGGADRYGFETGEARPFDDLVPGYYRGLLFPSRFLGLDLARTDAERCIVGRVDACRATFETGGRHPEISSYFELSRLSPATSVGQLRFTSEFGLKDGYLFRDLEAEFGEEAFARFWTSPLPPMDAFESAFGVEPGEWIVQWIDDYQGLDRAGPGLSRAASTGSLFTVGLFLLVAFSFQRRRTVVA